MLAEPLKFWEWREKWSKSQGIPWKGKGKEIEKGKEKKNREQETPSPPQDFSRKWLESDFLGLEMNPKSHFKVTFQSSSVVAQQCFTTIAPKAAFKRREKDENRHSSAQIGTYQSQNKAVKNAA